MDWMPLESAAALMSLSSTRRPRAADHCAMPAPMRPAPMTAAVLTGAGFASTPGSFVFLARSWRKKMPIRLRAASVWASSTKASRSRRNAGTFGEAQPICGHLDGAEGGGVVAARPGERLSCARARRRCGAPGRGWRRGFQRRAFAAREQAFGRGEHAFGVGDLVHEAGLLGGDAGELLAGENDLQMPSANRPGAAAARTRPTRAGCRSAPPAGRVWWSRR